MRTVLHVGQSKTGSTALQDCLLRSRGNLLRKGVLYPQNARGVPFNNHRLLMQPLVEHHRLPSNILEHCSDAEDCRKRHEAFVEAVKAQIRRSDPACLILSGEHLFRKLTDPGQAAFRQVLERIGVSQVEIAVYLRRPSARYLSMLQQALKTGRGMTQPTLPRLRAAFRSYATLFGKESLRPQVFDRSTMPGGDITRDFVQRFLESAGVTQADLVAPERSNESMSAESMQIFAWFSRDFGARPDLLRRLLQVLTDSERAVKTTRPVLRPDVADAIDYGSDELVWLRKRYGLEFPGYDYRRIERDGTLAMPAGPLSLTDLVVADRDVIDALLDKVARRCADTDLADWVSNLRARAT